MRRWTLPLLLAVNLGLLALLAWLWLTPQGQWKGVRWQPPTPLKPAFDSGAALPEVGVELGRYVATLERPLFAPSRRLPPPPQAASAPPPVVDMPPDLRVLGLYGQRGDGGSAAGMIVRIDGKVRRLRVGDTMGSWTFKEVRQDEAVLVLGATERTYPLRRAAADGPTVAASADERAPAPATGAARPAPAQTQIEKEMQAARDQVRQMNVRRARAGLPPLPEP